MNNLEEKEGTHLTKREKHLRRAKRKSLVFLPSTILFLSAILLFLGFITLSDKSQAKYSNLVMSMASFLLMFGFMYHPREIMHGRGITLTGKPAEIVRKAGIAICGFSGAYLLLFYLGFVK